MIDSATRPEAFFDRDLSQVAARVEVQPVEAELFAPPHFVEEGGAGFAQPLFVRMPQVDQVAVVRENLCRLVMIRPAVPAERFDRFGTERRGRPLALVLGEKGESGSPRWVCAFSGAFSTPPDALTCAPKYFMTNV